MQHNPILPVNALPLLQILHQQALLPLGRLRDLHRGSQLALRPSLLPILLGDRSSSPVDVLQNEHVWTGHEGDVLPHEWSLLLDGVHLIREAGSFCKE